MNFQTPVLDLSGSHAAVVKALLLNPLIFKQCATAMLTQTGSAASVATEDLD